MTSGRPTRRPSGRPSGRQARRPAKLQLAAPSRRLRVGFLLIAFVVSVFAGRLLQLQGVDASSWALRALETRLGTATLHAERGDITDRDGVSLATTVATVAVSADPELTSKKAAETARVLAPVLGLDVDDLEQKLSKPDTQFVYLARHVMPDTWSRAQDALQEANLSGVWADPDPLRTYPAGGIASNVVGFVGSDGHGLAGLEYALDDKLTGRDGWVRYERANGRQIPLGKEARKAPVPGANVRLTLDRDVQWQAQRAISEQVRNYDAESGSVVVLDARTGSLLALATAPGYDPSDPGSAAAEDRGNRPLQDVYEPGSVMKVLTAAALLDGGYVTPRTKISVPGSLTRNGEDIGDYWSHGTIPLTFAGAIAKSSNIGTVLAAERMPGREYAGYLAKFGIGEPTGLDYPGESDGLLSKPSEWSKLERATISFGQGLSVNAVQMASMLGAIANDGVRVPPTLVDGTVADGGDVDRAPRPDPVRAVSKSAADQVATMMTAVTGADGVAQEAAIPGYVVAGKTGTAQRVDPECGCYRGYSASFGGFVPADGARYVVYTVVHDPQGSHSGSEVAAPVFQKVMKFVLQKYGVPPTGATPPEVPLTW